MDVEVAEFTGNFHHGGGADDVALDEFKRIQDRAVDVRFSGEV